MQEEIADQEPVKLPKRVTEMAEWLRSERERGAAGALEAAAERILRRTKGEG